MTNMSDLVPSTKAKIRNNVVAIAAKVGRSQGAVWRQLYDAFEYASNTPWRKLAHNRDVPVLQAIAQAGKLEELLVSVQALAVAAGLSAPPKEEAPCVVCGQDLEFH